MTTFVLTSETASLSVAHLLQRADGGGVEIRDADGNVVAVVISPADEQALTYVEANLDLNEHMSEVRQSLARRGGVTTEQLLANAAVAARDAGK